ncbi:hypothetical protein K438DRAFT_1771170 [Mycena galopus ATCC 62051]|nr:hypothetical protein K438DRAFT_1771170 [Mycena galopus ATCC 62051]
MRPQSIGTGGGEMGGENPSKAPVVSHNCSKITYLNSSSSRRWKLEAAWRLCSAVSLRCGSQEQENPVTRHSAVTRHCTAFRKLQEYVRGTLEALQLYIEGDEWEESLALYPDIFQCTTTTLKRVSFTCGHSSHILDIFPLPPSDWQSIAVSIIAEEEEGTEMDLRTIDAALAGSEALLYPWRRRI